MTAYTATDKTGNWSATSGIWSPSGSYPGQNQDGDTASLVSTDHFKQQTITLNVSPPYRLALVQCDAVKLLAPCGSSLTLLVDSVQCVSNVAYTALTATGSSGAFQIGSADHLANVGGASNHTNVAFYNKSTGTASATIYGTVYGKNGTTATDGTGVENSGLLYVYGSCSLVYTGQSIGISVRNVSTGVVHIADQGGVPASATGVSNSGVLYLDAGASGDGVNVGGGAYRGVLNYSGAQVVMTAGMITGGTAAGVVGLRNESTSSNNRLVGVTITGGSGSATSYGLDNAGTIRLADCTIVDGVAPAINNTGTIVWETAGDIESQVPAVSCAMTGAVVPPVLGSLAVTVSPLAAAIAGNHVPLGSTAGYMIAAVGRVAASWAGSVTPPITGTLAVTCARPQTGLNGLLAIRGTMSVNVSSPLVAMSGFWTIGGPIVVGVPGVVAGLVGVEYTPSVLSPTLGQHIKRAQRRCDPARRRRSVPNTREIGYGKQLSVV